MLLSGDHRLIVGLHAAVLEKGEPKVLASVVEPVAFDESRELIIVPVTRASVALPSRPDAGDAVGRADIPLPVARVRNEVYPFGVTKGSLPVRPLPLD